MRGTLVFVHGTGVRQEGFDATFAVINEGCRRSGLDGIDIVGTPWGAQLGVPIESVGKALPAEVVTRDAFGGIELSDTDIDAARWDLLLEDPLFELRLVAESGQSEEVGVVVGEALPDQAVEDALRRVQDTPPATERTGIDSAELAASTSLVMGTDELRGAAVAIGDAADPDLVEAMARAVVAATLAAHRLDSPGTEPAATLNAELRNSLVSATADVIAPERVKGIGGWLKEKVIGFAAKRATAAVLERRAPLQGASTPGIGDILFYQRRGTAIVDLVRKDLISREGPIVAVGHSLGGIILVDLLSRSDAPPVDLLVTAGSQSPMFFAIDALEELRPGGPVAPFSPWLNIYNRRDFLSFVTKGLWPGTEGLTDAEVDPGVPFPESHSAYWHAEETYRLIRDAWPS